LFKLIIAEDTKSHDLGTTGPPNASPCESPVVFMALRAKRILATHFDNNFKTLADGLQAVRGCLPQPILRRLDLVNKAASVVRHIVEIDSDLLALLSKELDFL
jgi:hypothetical protein